MNENKQPIIVKFLEQKCVGYRFETTRAVSIFSNIAVDKDGKKWRFLSEYYDDHATGITRAGRQYNYEGIQS